MLVVSRKVDETIEIRPREGANGGKLEEVFARGPIRIQLVRLGRGRVKIGVDAPPELEIWRGGAPMRVVTAEEHLNCEEGPSAAR